jgi:hypothetical protein
MADSRLGKLMSRVRRLAKPVRITIGVTLVVLGVLGFLPVLGFWMLPLGLYALSVDFAVARRLRRKLDLWWGRRRKRRDREGALQEDQS